MRPPAVHPEPDRVPPGALPARQPDRQRRRQPAVGRWLGILR